jgi:hypothetical protein
MDLIMRGIKRDMFGFSFGLTDGLTPLDIPTVTQQLEQGKVGFSSRFGINSV